MKINIFETLPRLWFENENGDRQIPPVHIQDHPDALSHADNDGAGGFIFQHVLIHSVVGHDVICKDPNTDEIRHVSREFLPFDHKLVEGLVRHADMDLRTATFIAIEACERCQMALQYRYKFGIGYDFDDPLYLKHEARCRICFDEVVDDSERPEWFSAALAIMAEQTPPEGDAL